MFKINALQFLSILYFVTACKQVDILCIDKAYVVPSGIHCFLTGLHLNNIIVCAVNTDQSPLDRTVTAHLSSLQTQAQASGKRLHFV